jgi:hypothetical protein
MGNKDKALEILRELVTTQGMGMRGVLRTTRLHSEARVLLRQIDSDKERRAKRKEEKS